MTIYYVDPSAGSNANSGSNESAPFKDFTPINAGLWNGNEIRVKRGSSGTVSDASRPLIEAAAGCLLTTYGDAAAPRPIIYGDGNTAVGLWIRNGTGVIVEGMHVRRSAANGIAIQSPAGMSLSGTILMNCIASDNCTFAGISETSGINIGGINRTLAGAWTTNPGTVTNTIVQDCIANDNGGNGIKARGWVNGASILRCTALRNGRTIASHGIGTSGEFLRMDNYFPSGHPFRISEGWTTVATVGGYPVQEHYANANPFVTTTSAWNAVWVLGAGPTYYQLPFYTADPANPPPGYCGIGAVNTVRVNLGGVTSASALVQMYCGFARPENINVRDCVTAYTYLGPSGIEGQGVYFDQGSYKCFSHNCTGIENQGHGAFLNDPTECGHFGFYGYNNAAGGAFVARGVNSNIYGCTLICLPGTIGIGYSTGNVGAKARRNQIIGAATGIWTNGASSNSVTEDENIFVGVTTRLTQVSGVGARSLDQAASANRTPNMRYVTAARSITAAEMAA